MDSRSSIDCLSFSFLAALILGCSLLYALRVFILSDKRLEIDVSSRLADFFALSLLSIAQSPSEFGRPTRGNTLLILSTSLKIGWEETHLGKSFTLNSSLVEIIFYLLEIFKDIFI